MSFVSFTSFVLVFLSTLGESKVSFEEDFAVGGFGVVDIFVVAAVVVVFIGAVDIFFVVPVLVETLTAFGVFGF